MTLPGFTRRLLITISLWGLGFSAALTCVAAPAANADHAVLKEEAEKTFREKVTPFMKTYCANCHGDKKMKGGITFSPALKNPSAASSSIKWKQALASVKTHDMPPDEADKQPTEEERKQFMDWIDNVKYLSPKEPGAFVIRRLTKVEYSNTLQDLFGVDPVVAKDLPDEVFGAGYLNTLSPMQSEQYLEIANNVLDTIIAPKGSPPSAVHLRLFGPEPAAGQDVRESARNVARSIARNAYRRPVFDSELDVLMGVFDLAQKNKLDYTASLRLMLKAILVSPQFLFITPNQETAPNQEIVPLDDHQLASRLSYLLWATMPDAELSRLADSGKLHDPAVLQAQVKRLLADKRSRALFDGFGAQWLGIGDLKSQTFDTTKFPLMTSEMRKAMYTEARLFFNSIIQGNKSVVSFVNSDYTYLNGTLASLYGMEKTITGPEMRKVQLTDPNRGGILAMPGILATTSFPNRTSPVKRGVWVLEQVLGEHVPSAPPNVPALEKQDKKKIANLTLRQRTELHRTNEACANCHKILDPIGFGLENFDAIGRWRDQDDTGGAIDAVGELPGGKHFSTPKELKAIIALREPDLARNLTQKLLAYALCRQLEGYDEIVVDQLMQPIAKDGYRIQTLITRVITSYPFLNHRIKEPESTPEVLKTAKKGS